MVTFIKPLNKNRGFFLGYMGLDSYVMSSITALMKLPDVLLLPYGVISDCFPICGWAAIGMTAGSPVCGCPIAHPAWSSLRIVPLALLAHSLHTEVGHLSDYSCDSPESPIPLN